MKRRRIVERPRGIGVLKKDDQYVADVQYSLMVVQEYIIIDEFREVEGFAEITGSFKIVIGDVGNTFHDSFTLELEDGRALGVNATCEDVSAKIFSITVNDASKFKMRELTP